MIQDLEDYLVSLDQVAAQIHAAPTFISRADIKKKVAEFGKAWFPISTRLRAGDFPSEDCLNRIDEAVEKLIELTMASNNRKSTYKKNLDSLKKTVQKEVLVPLIKSGRSVPLIWEGVAAQILRKTGSPEEKQFYEEAFTCAKANCYKAATVMVASGIVDRLRKFVLARGLKSFNATSQKLKVISSGYYKRFSKEFSLSLDNELQEVFERDLVIVISGMVALDLNVTAGILHLLDTRNSCAHPSAYIMDELGFAHFLNEASKLVLDNKTLS